MVYFLPFTMGLHHCCIVFEDSECGSFMYEMTGDGRLPHPARPLTFQVPSSPCPPRATYIEPTEFGQIPCAGF